MKIDKSNPQHWMMLLWSSCMLLLAVPSRALKTRSVSRRPLIVFYGHALNGNLLALYRHWMKQDGVDCYFLSFDDKKNTEKINNSGFQTLDAMKFTDLLKLVRADALVSSHGIHHFIILRKLTQVKFIDVFHAPLAYKGFDSDDFRHLHGHNQSWVSSERVRAIQVGRYGFEGERVKVTGCARVEDIEEYAQNASLIKNKYGLAPDKTTILIAPTWKQDNRSRSIVPFGLTLEKFMESVLSVARNDDIQVIFRAHLNSGDSHKINDMRNVHILPYSVYPNAEEFIAISDVLVNDWSSIAFDFMTTNNPVVFLDVKPPFAKGFSAGPENRFGAVVGGGEELVRELKRAVYSPDEYQKIYTESIADTKDLVFGSTLDGGTLSRCDEELFSLLNVSLPTDER